MCLRVIAVFSSSSPRIELIFPKGIEQRTIAKVFLIKLRQSYISVSQADEFTPSVRFDILQQRINGDYYRNIRRDIYSDFKTFGNCNKVAYADAIGFLRNFAPIWDGGSEINIYEMGVGNGRFALNFLDAVAKILGRQHSFTKHINYFLCDIAFRVERGVRERLKKFNVFEVEADTTESLSFMKRPAYVRSNEMYDDLPARVFVRRGDEVYEVYYDDGLHCEYVLADRLDRHIASRMLKMPDSYHIPVNIECAKNMKRVVDRLPKYAYFDFYDYGFSSVDEIGKIPVEAWNAQIIREYGGQLTIDVNFMFLRDEAKRMKMHYVCEGQQHYAERILGTKLYRVELDGLYYMTMREMEGHERKLKRYGYDIGLIRAGVEEADDYKHARVSKI